MILEEYDEERHMRSLQKNSEERGRQEGRIEGRSEINLLNQKLINLNRLDDLKRAASDPVFQTHLMKELGLLSQD